MSWTEALSFVCLCGIMVAVAKLSRVEARQRKLMFEWEIFMKDWQHCQTFVVERGPDVAATDDTIPYRD